MSDCVTADATSTAGNLHPPDNDDDNNNNDDNENKDNEDDDRRRIRLESEQSESAHQSPSSSTTGCGGRAGDGVCRDFLRNVCRRGDRCRFQHPADPTSARRDVIAAAHHRPLVFCHDFQNAAGCKRTTGCRFAHCTRDEEATYRRTGLLPVHVQRKLAIDVAVARALLRGETPVCLDFIKAGGCRRANGKCRYRHVTADEFEREQLTVADDRLRQGSLLQCDVDAFGRQGPAQIVYRKRKLSPDDGSCDDLVQLCGAAGSKLVAGNGFETMTSSVGQLFAVIDPVGHLAANRWTAAAMNNFRSPFCVGGPCRLVAIPTCAPAFSAIRPTVQQFASSPSSAVAMVTAPASAAHLGLFTVMQPYV